MLRQLNNSEEVIFRSLSKNYLNRMPDEDDQGEDKDQDDDEGDNGSGPPSGPGSGT